MYKDKFVVSVIHDGSPLKETGPKHRREVSIPFNSEYKIRIKNKNEKGCTARVYVDGKRVSALGDFILQPRVQLDLERYVDRCLTDGRKFKFVPLDHPDVDDPTSSDNGIIKVEFRMARNKPISIKPDYYRPYKPWEDWQIPGGWSVDDWTIYYTSSPHTSLGGGTFKGYDSYHNGGKSCGIGEAMARGCATSFYNNAGATVEGGKSNQSFHYTDMDVEETPSTIIKLKMVGIDNVSLKRKSVGSDSSARYCPKCGYRVRRSDNFCYKCGNRL